MSHYGTNAKIRPETDNSWLMVGASVGDLVNKWAGRHDLIAYVGERAGEEAGAPAAFNPTSSEIEVNSKVAFGNATPADVADLTIRAQQFQFPKATGAIYHEAMHAKFSDWDLVQASKDLTSGQLKAMHLLEESRIERLGVLMNPDNQVFLRACALEIVLADMKAGEMADMSSTRQAAQVLALTSARVDAGVLELSDIIEIRTLVDTKIPKPTYTALRNVWVEFQGLDSTRVARMYELAIEWDKLVEDLAEENGEGKDSESASGQDGESADGSGQGQGAGSLFSQAFAEAMSDILEEAVEVAQITAIDAVDDQKTIEDYRAQTEEAESKKQEHKEHKDIGDSIFGGGASIGPEGKSRSKLKESRPATSEERISAVKIAKSLEKAKYQDRVRTSSASAVPPGRLRSRTLVQGVAQREKGIIAQAEPFKRIQRKHVDDPNLTIGVMVDISGSMGSAMQPVGSAAWILSEATRRIQGRVAMNYFGSSVFATLKPGQYLSDVNIYTAPDGDHRFSKAFKALNGTLNLLDGSGARLLVVVSDGVYGHREEARVEEWVARCKQAGVAVLWIGAGVNGRYATKFCDRGTGAVFTRMKQSATGVADDIGRAAVEALTQAGNRR